MPYFSPSHDARIVSKEFESGVQIRARRVIGNTHNITYYISGYLMSGNFGRFAPKRALEIFGTFYIGVFPGFFF